MVMKLAEIGIAIFLAIALFAFMPSFFSSSFLVVLSGSMSPAINAGDLIISSPAGADSIKAGDIVVFTENKTKITHRVVNVTASGFITKGDANENPDAQIRKKSDVFGKAVFWIPFAGYFVNFARSAYGFVLLIIIPGTLLIAGEIRKIHFHVKNPDGGHAARIPRTGGSAERCQPKSACGSNPGERKKLKVVIAKSVLLIVFSSAVMQQAFISTNAYLSDTETSAGNSISAWAEGAAFQDCGMAVNATGARLIANSLFDIVLMNNNTNQSADIVINEIKTSWSPDNGEKLQYLVLQGTQPDIFYTNWTGGALSGALIDGADFTLKHTWPNTQIPVAGKVWMNFNANMIGKDITIEFHMKGCAPESVTFSP